MPAIPTPPSLFSPVVIVLGMAAVLIAGCLLLTGCSNDQPALRAQHHSAVETGSISRKAYERRAVVVRPGDTISSIARRNNVTAYDLVSFNNLNSTRIAVGQTLYLPSY